MANRKILKMIAASIALSAAAAAIWSRVVVRPERAYAQKRYESTMDLATLYGLQLSYKRAKGTYANDLAALLSIDPDGAALKASLAANVDLTTLTVDGDAKKFKLELNVLDPARTLIQIKGPIRPRAPDARPLTLPALAPPLNADGAPITSGL